VIWEIRPKYGHFFHSLMPTLYVSSKHLFHVYSAWLYAYLAL
jgi:hypothetical protein